MNYVSRTDDPWGPRPVALTGEQHAVYLNAYDPKVMFRMKLIDLIRSYSIDHKLSLSYTEVAQIVDHFLSDNLHLLLISNES